MSEAAGSERTSFRTVSRRAHASEIDLDRDLPQLLPPLQPLERGARLREGEHPIDDRSQLPCTELAHGLAILGVVAHGGAQDAPLIPEQPTDVEPNLGPARPAAGHQSPTPPQRAERLVPGCLAHVV